MILPEEKISELDTIALIPALSGKLAIGLAINGEQVRQ
jgi:hypothetical protein